MLLACFSHVELWHIGINMLVLWSFMQTFECKNITLHYIMYTLSYHTLYFVIVIVGKDLTIPFFISAGMKTF